MRAQTLVLVAGVLVVSAGTPGAAAPGAAGARGTMQEPAGCEVTLPKPPFVAPEPFDLEPPATYGAAWFGTEALWTMLDREGERWPAGVGKKMFWWSTSWHAAAEQVPRLSVTGRRLDATGSFTAGRGTNVTADFGTAMLVGVDIPVAGCWELSARYDDAILTIVVSVVP
jgi:hypothetical protein